MDSICQNALCKDGEDSSVPSSLRRAVPGHTTHPAGRGSGHLDLRTLTHV